MEATELVLQTMREAGTPLAAGKIAELSGLERKVVDKAMKELKATGTPTCTPFLPQNSRHLSHTPWPRVRGPWAVPTSAGSLLRSRPCPSL